MSKQGRIWSPHAVKLPCLDHQHRIKLLESEKTQMSVRSTKALFDRVWRLRHRAVM